MRQSKVRRLGYAGWAAVYIAALFAAVAVYRLGLIPGRHADLITFAPLALVPFMARAQMGWLSDKGISSSALRRYNARGTTALLVYVAVLVASSRFRPQIEPGSALMWFVALVPIVPLLAVLWAGRRYLVEENDEYLRQRAVSAALFGLGFVLILGTVWGFLEQFGALPHIPAWWVFPAWAIGLGVANFRHFLRVQ